MIETRALHGSRRFRLMKLKRFTIIGKALPFVLAVITFSVQAAGRSYRQINRALVSRAEQVTGDKFPIVTTTPRGVTVLARTMPRLDLLNAIDRGLADLFAVAQPMASLLLNTIETWAGSRM